MVRPRLFVWKWQHIFCLFYLWQCFYPLLSKHFSFKLSLWAVFGYLVWSEMVTQGDKGQQETGWCYMTPASLLPTPQHPLFYTTNPYPYKSPLESEDPALSMANKSSSRPSFEIIVCRVFEGDTGPLAHPHTCTEAAPFILRAALFDVSTSLSECIVSSLLVYPRSISLKYKLILSTYPLVHYCYNANCELQITFIVYHLKFVGPLKMKLPPHSLVQSV